MKKFTLLVAVLVLLFSSVGSIIADEEVIDVEDLTIQTWDDIDRIMGDLDKALIVNPELTEDQINDFIISEATSDKYNVSTYSAYSSWNTLTGEERKLVLLYPHQVSKVNTGRKFAENSTKKNFRDNFTDDNSDAYRHCIWNMHMTSTMSAAIAKKWSDAHESESSGLSKSMDLFNNRIGWEQSSYGLGEAVLEYRAYNLTKYGGLKRFRDGKVVYTYLIPTKI